MKKTFLTVAVVLTSTLYMATPAQAVQAQFEWGGTWLTLCEGSGVCKSCFPSADCNAEVNFDQTTNSILFEVPEDLIPADKLDLFKGTKFIVDNEYILPDELCDALGIPSGSTLQKGSYTLAYQAHTYYFSINI